mgnify:CR=1 FL=1
MKNAMIARNLEHQNVLHHRNAWRLIADHISSQNIKWRQTEINMSAIDRNITQYENWLTKAEEEEMDLKNRLADITVQKAIYRSALYTLREMKRQEQKLENNGDN